MEQQAETTVASAIRDFLRLESAGGILLLIAALVALVIAVFAYLQAVTDSAFSTMAATGDPNTVIVLNQGADSETVSGMGGSAGAAARV